MTVDAGGPVSAGNQRGSVRAPRIVPGRRQVTLHTHLGRACLICGRRPGRRFLVRIGVVGVAGEAAQLPVGGIAKEPSVDVQRQGPAVSELRLKSVVAMASEAIGVVLGRLLRYGRGRAGSGPAGGGPAR